MERHISLSSTGPEVINITSTQWPVCLNSSPCSEIIAEEAEKHQEARGMLVSPNCPCLWELLWKLRQEGLGRKVSGSH